MSTTTTTLPPQKSLADANRLLELLDLVSTSVRAVIAAWAAPPASANVAGTENLVSWELFQAQRVLLSATGVLTELVANPSSRLLEVSSQYNESRALHLAASLRLADRFEAATTAGQAGVGIDDLSRETGIESRKLGRLLRCLCSIHVFREVQDNVFANNAISHALVANEPLRAYIMLFGYDLYTASDHLPRTLLDKETGPSYDVQQTAFQKAVGTTKPRWEWLEEEVPPSALLAPQGQGYPGPYGPDLQAAVQQQQQHVAAAAEKEGADAPADPAGTVKRPEHGTFGLAMLGGGRVTGTAHLYDFPWGGMGEATVVDVGGGVGGFCVQLSHLYPDLKFVVQDRAPVLEQAKTTIWPKENPAALASGRVSFMPHNFFDENPVKGADVYWLRYIIHDWSDDYCVQILSALRAAMAPHSRLLICDQVMNTTVGSAQIAAAPAPLPANYGVFARWSHQRDLTMMSIINGIERTPAEFDALVRKAGLHIRRFYDCRSQVGLVECVLPSVAVM